MGEGIIISIFSISQLFIIVASLKNVFVNANGYSKNIRAMMFALFITYEAISITIISGILMIQPENVIKILNLVILISFSVIFLHTAVYSDFRKIGVKKQWEIETNYKTKEQSPKQCSSFDLMEGILKLLPTIFIIGSSIWVLSFNVDGIVWNITVAVFMALVIAMFCINVKLQNLIEKNIEYNFLKDKLFNEREKIRKWDKTKADKYKDRMLCLFEEIYSGRMFYRSEYAKSLNKGIMKEIENIFNEEIKKITKIKRP